MTITPPISEDRLQAEIWTKAWNEYPEARRCMWAVPNGFKLPPRLANIAKATGLLSGVWDLHLYWRHQLYVFEQKIDNNQLTVDRIIKGKKIYGQKEWGEIMRREGAITFIIRDIDEFFIHYDKIIRP